MSDMLSTTGTVESQIPVFSPQWCPPLTMLTSGWLTWGIYSAVHSTLSMLSGPLHISTRHQSLLLLLPVLRVHVFGHMLMQDMHPVFPPPLTFLTFLVWRGIWTCPQVRLELRTGLRDWLSCPCYNPIGGAVSGSAGSTSLAGSLTY